LIALAVGDLKGIEIGPRTTVWSEPEVVRSIFFYFEKKNQSILMRD
jgi:leukotriene-A4 hydrolase